MKDTRRLRYSQKVNFIIDNLQLLGESPTSELEKRGIIYTVLTTVEAMTDLIAMAIKDMGIEVREDTRNIDTIIEALCLDVALGDRLKQANGMRNVLVHRYNGVDENIVLDSLLELKDDLAAWLDVIETLLRSWEHD